MCTNKHNNELIFFLGAGASIDAGFVDVVGLKDELLKWLQKNSSPENLSLTKEILVVLKNWKINRNDKSDIDIELLLEIVEKLENKDEDPLMDFLENKKMKLESSVAYKTIIKKKETSKIIKNFIQVYFSQTDIFTDYLVYLKDFIEQYKPLHIFSTNYDICIEQFCEKNRVNLVDAYDSVTGPLKAEDNQKIDIILHKLHGSITLYRTEQRDYTRSDIVITNGMKISHNSGKDIVPVILYPGRKFEYYGPTFDNLSDLKRLLRSIRCVIVVGYSFKDSYIAKIFEEVAKENNDLILFLIGPNACKIYQDRLEAINDPEIIHGFAYRGFTNGFDKQVASNLEGKVIPLSYGFAKILPLLTDYLKKLNEAQAMYKELCVSTETKTDSQKWRNCLRLYVECEHMTKATKIMDMQMINLLTNDWFLTFEISFYGLLNALSCDDKQLITKWKDYFLKVCKLFAIDKFSFDPMIEDNLPEIRYN